MLFCHSTGSKQTEPDSHRQKTLKSSAKIHLWFLKWPSQEFCHSSGKLAFLLALILCLSSRYSVSAVLGTQRSWEAGSLLWGSRHLLVSSHQHLFPLFLLTAWNCPKRHHHVSTSTIASFTSTADSPGLTLARNSTTPPSAPGTALDNQSKDSWQPKAIYLVRLWALHPSSPRTWSSKDAGPIWVHSLGPINTV